jgi:conjugal transfer pilus assembly protein TraE
MKIKQLAEDFAFRTGVKSVFQGLLIFSIVSNLCLAVALAAADRTHRETLVPPNINKTFWVDDSKVSAEYLEQMGHFVIQLALDNTPANVDYNAKMLLKYAAPASYGELEKVLLMNAKRLKDEGASTMFSARAMTPNDADNSVAFNGILTTWIGDKRVSQLSKNYLLKFGYSAGRVYVLELRETDERHPFKEPAEAESRQVGG